MLQIQIYTIFPLRLKYIIMWFIYILQFNPTDSLKNEGDFNGSLMMFNVQMI